MDRRDLLAETFDSLDVKGAAQDASPNLIFGTSPSSSASARASVIAAKLNYPRGNTIIRYDSITASQYHTPSP